MLPEIVSSEPQDIQSIDSIDLARAYAAQVIAGKVVGYETMQAERARISELILSEKTAPETVAKLYAVLQNDGDKIVKALESMRQAEVDAPDDSAIDDLDMDEIDTLYD